MPEPEVLSARLEALQDDVSEIKAATQKVADAVERLARLEERHTTVAGALERAFSAISKLEQRVRVLEAAQPVQTLVSGWVTKAMYTSAGALVVLLMKKVGVI